MDFHAGGPSRFDHELERRIAEGVCRNRKRFAEMTESSKNQRNTEILEKLTRQSHLEIPGF
jgi:hypothetical protein